MSALDGRPGRSCPTAYRYAPRALRPRAGRRGRDALVVGGLYGNVEALDEVARHGGARARRRRRSSSTATSTGSTRPPDDFRRVAGRGAAPCRPARQRGDGDRRRGLAAPAAAAPIPLDVSDAGRRRAPTRSWRGCARRRARFPAARRALAALPMHARGARGRGARGHRARRRVLAGRLGVRAGRPRRPRPSPLARQRVRGMRGVDVFASSHTCLPALRAFDFGHGRGGGRQQRRGGHAELRRRALRRDHAHLGAPAPGTPCTARGWPAFSSTRSPCATTRPPGRARFIASWPAGSAAHDSYFRRIAHGPGFARRTRAAAGGLSP